MRLARRGAKLAHPLGCCASAPRTMNNGQVKQVTRPRDGFLGRGNPKSLELPPAAVTEPIARPRRRQHLLQHGIAVAALIERLTHRAPDDFSSRATGVRWSDPDVQSTVQSRMRVSHDPKLDDAEDRYLGVHDILEHAPYRTLVYGRFVLKCGYH